MVKYKIDMKRSCSHHNGFTLIEIIVSLSIIGILTAILFPVLASVRRKGHDATCLSNLRQLGMATRLYSDDSDGRYPYAIDPRSRVNPAGSFVSLELVDELPDYPAILSPYLKTSSVFHCPSDTDEDFERWKTSYYYNESLIFYYSWGKIQAANTSRLSLYYDADDWHGIIESSGIRDYFVQAVYADLHVKRVRIGQLSDEELNELGEEGVENEE